MLSLVACDNKSALDMPSKFPFNLKEFFLVSLRYVLSKIVEKFNNCNLSR